MNFLFDKLHGKTIGSRLLIVASVLIGIFILIVIPILITLPIPDGETQLSKIELLFSRWVVGFIFLLFIMLVYNFIKWIIKG